MRCRTEPPCESRGCPRNGKPFEGRPRRHCRRCFVLRWREGWMARMASPETGLHPTEARVDECARSGRRQRDAGRRRRRLPVRGTASRTFTRVVLPALRALARSSASHPDPCRAGMHGPRGDCDVDPPLKPERAGWRSRADPGPTAKRGPGRVILGPCPLPGRRWCGIGAGRDARRPPAGARPDRRHRQPHGAAAARTSRRRHGDRRRRDRARRRVEPRRAAAAAARRRDRAERRTGGGVGRVPARGESRPDAGAGRRPARRLVVGRFDDAGGDPARPDRTDRGAARARRRASTAPTPSAA